MYRNFSHKIKKEINSRETYRRNMKKKIVSFFDHPNKSDLIDILDSLLTFKGMQNTKWFVEERILTKVSLKQFTDRLEGFLTKEESPSKKIETFNKNKIPGLGIPLISEFLWIMYPKDFAVINSRAIEGFEKLAKDLANQLSKNVKRYQKVTGREYAKYLELLEKLNERLIVEDLGFTGIDVVFDKITRGKLSPEDVLKDQFKRKKQINGVKAAIQRAKNFIMEETLGGEAQDTIPIFEDYIIEEASRNDNQYKVIIHSNKIGKTITIDMLTDGTIVNYQMKQSKENN